MAGDAVTNDAMALVRERLLPLVDQEYQRFNAKLVPTVPAERVLGVRMPALRSLATELSKTESVAVETFLQVMPHEYLEENHLHGLFINRVRDFDRAVAALDAFLPHVDNWATCDLLKPAAFVRAERTPEGRAALEREAFRWIVAPPAQTYTRRYGVSVLMTHLLDDGFRTEQLDAVVAIGAGDYYVDMMVAWYVATALAKQWDKTLPYLQNRCLPEWTHRKAIQKACESRRITLEQKAYLKTLR